MECSDLLPENNIQCEIPDHLLPITIKHELTMWLEVLIFSTLSVIAQQSGQNPPLTWLLSIYIDFHLLDLCMKVDSLLLNSVAPSTRRVYDRAMVSYFEFCEQYSIEDKYSSHTIELFVAHLANKGIKSNSIRSTLSGIRHHCNINSIKFEHNTPRIAMMLRGVGRSAETSTRSKNALRIRHLQKMCNATVQLFEHKIATMLRSLFTLSFFAMLRPSEMLYTSTDRKSVV